MHGNLPALEAVLADARACKVASWVLGGDYALFGGWPAETLARLRELKGARWIRGNVDRWIAEGAGHEPVLQEAVDACRRELGATAAEALGALPEHHELGDTFFCHASPRSDLESFLPQAAETDEELLDGVSASRVVFGHTHLQFRRRGPRGIELINPGSLGMPLDGDVRAAWAAIASDGSVSFRRVGYDHEAAAAAVLERFGGSQWTARSARRLRTAQP